MQTGLRLCWLHIPHCWKTSMSWHISPMDISLTFCWVETSAMVLWPTMKIHNVFFSSRSVLFIRTKRGQIFDLINWCHSYNHYGKGSSGVLKNVLLNQINYIVNSNSTIQFYYHTQNVLNEVSFFQIVIASIMCSFSKEDWTELAVMSEVDNS